MSDTFALLELHKTDDASNPNFLLDMFKLTFELSHRNRIFLPLEDIHKIVSVRQQCMHEIHRNILSRAKNHQCDLDNRMEYSLERVDLGSKI